MPRVPSAKSVRADRLADGVSCRSATIPSNAGLLARIFTMAANVCCNAGNIR